MESIPSPWDFNKVQDGQHQLLEDFHGERTGYIQVGPKKYFFPSRFGKDGPSFYKFKPRASDTWVVTYPRSGTTVTQELVWLVCNQFNFQKAAQIPLGERFPFFEFSACVDESLLEELKNGKDFKTVQVLSECTREILDNLNACEQPRFIKSHLPFSLLPPDLLTCGAKVIYMARNPKDVAVSYYHLHRLFKTLDYVGNFEKFWNYFEQDRLMWSPYWDHIKEAWDLRHNPNLLFIFYKELNQNMVSAIYKIGSFLGCTITPKECEDLAQHLDVTNFRNNPSVNYRHLLQCGLFNDRENTFIRNGGSSGEQDTDFTPDLIKRADEWIQRNLRDTSFRFPT